jgi:hypothetical protein
MDLSDEKTEFNARAKASMLVYLKSKSWEEKVRSIERMNQMGLKAREAMREARAKAVTGDQNRIAVDIQK